MIKLIIGMLIGLLLAVILVIGGVISMLLLQHYVNIALERSRTNDHRRMDRDRK